MAYTKPQFEAYFQLMSALSHQMLKIDFGEMIVWVDKIVGPDALHSDQRKQDLLNLHSVIGGFIEMQKIVRKHGIPVRDPRQEAKALLPTTPKVINPDP